MNINTSDYPYGYRRSTAYNDHAGQPHYLYAALKQSDFLNPHEDDHFVLGENHERDVAELYRVLQNHHRHQPKFTIYRALKMIWGIDGLDQPTPDLAIVRNVHVPEKPRRVFDVRQEKVRPCTILEFVSPLFAEYDFVDKVQIYAQAGIDEYFVINGTQSNAKADTLFNSGQHVYSVVGYRLVEGAYRPIEPDSRGHLYSPINDFWIAPNPDAPGVLLIDGESGIRVEAVDVVAEKKIAELQGDRRGREILSALNFLQ